MRRVSRFALAVALLLAAPAAASASPTAVLDAPSQVEVNTTIALDGTQSLGENANAPITEYRWTVGSRPVVRTFDATFDAPGLPAGRYQLQLVVRDVNGVLSAPAVRQLVVRDSSAPTAILDAPERSALNRPVRLSGTRSSDLGGTIVEYRWTVAGRPVVATSGPTFDAPGLPNGVHAATLVVVDDSGNQSTPDQRTIVVDGEAPTAVLDVPDRVEIGARPAISAARSVDLLGRIVSYTFAVDGGPPIQTSDPALSLAPLPLGRHTVTLRVTDDSGLESAPVQAVLFVVDTASPTAIIRAPSSVTAGTAFTLDGSRSTDIGGRVIEYRWTVDGRPVVATSEPTFVAPAISTTGTKRISLVVVDDAGNESPPTIASISVTAPTGTKLTTFTFTRLIAPVRKRTAQIFLGDRMLLAGRVFSRKAVRLDVTFLRGKRRLGLSTVKIPANGTMRLDLKLSPTQVRGLRVGQRLRLRLRAKTGSRVVTRSVRFSVVTGTMPGR